MAHFPLKGSSAGHPLAQETQPWDCLVREMILELGQLGYDPVLLNGLGFGVAMVLGEFRQAVCLL